MRTSQKKSKQLKNSRQLERHFKGVANHWRVDILLVIAQEPGITVEELSQWFLTQLAINTEELAAHCIQKIIIKSKIKTGHQTRK